MSRLGRVYDVIVIGGGVVGGSLAYHLAEGGAATLLLDRLDPGRASDAGAGIISPETYGDKPENWVDFALEARDYYPALVKKLEKDGIIKTGYAEPGILIAAFDDDEMPAFEHTRAEIFNRQRQKGRPSAEDLRQVSPEDAQNLFPALARPQGAVHFRQAARVEGRVLNPAFNEH